MYRVTTYRKQYNLGDIFQTIALCKLLGKTISIPRDDIPSERFKDTLYVVNGWHARDSEVPILDYKCLFAGVYSKFSKPFINWFSQSPYAFGVRDPFSFKKAREILLKKNVEMIGCSTLTFNKYYGPREEIYSVDVEGPGLYLTHKINDNSKDKLSFEGSWFKAKKYLNLYKKLKQYIHLDYM